MIPDPGVLLPPAPRLIATITPSGNTVVERTTQAMLRDLPGAAALFARTPVRGSRDPFPDRHNLEGMLQAAELLSDAAPQAIVWNGSKGMAIGLDHDRALAAAITERTGIPATTSALRLMALVESTGCRRLGLITPYTEAAQARLVQRLAAEGLEIVSESGLGMTDNLSYASVPYDTILGQVERVRQARPDAILAWCTNYPAAPLAELVERRFGMPLWDATALGILAGLELAGITDRPTGWGSLLAGCA
ncbi:hypothetical protein LPC08_21515 [Roseomonas sp. OT10]|uniref:maleate cis-trans isomerase family protein n=1 Tax=Roseomonas cutis TaxID=2897332 RepID=UPI001E284755|nr:hypothetical protein [Roseomonas sp. OT10]UFN48560.1 hypothetical protein LPC08_21515 [Roseomonas sp. OT10]